jgi:hypothetical protein
MRAVEDRLITEFKICIDKVVTHLAIRRRREARLPIRLENLFNYEEHSIIYHDKSGSVFICGSKRSGDGSVEQEFVDAF